MNSKKKKIILIILSIILVVFLCVYIFMISYSWGLVKDYKDKVYPHVYMGNYDFSNIKNNEVEEYINKIEEELRKEKIKFKVNLIEYEYSLKDLNITIDKEKMLNEVLNYQKSLSYSKRINQIVGKNKKIFTYKVNYNENDIKLFVTNLKSVVDKVGNDAKLVMNENKELIYQNATQSFNLNVEKSTEKILNYLKNDFKNLEIELVGESNNYKDNDLLKTINTKVSTYSTKYNAYISRGKNLETALNYLNGTIINSGEVFSYFKVAGPYNKKGYVYYDKMIGNGVCQIASTMYNTALIGGLEIKERHQHQLLLPYVPGGQDATVVSNGNNNVLDFKFKNTYKYPIYISAFYNNGVATVEFWSNNNAKEGKEYTIESVPLGNRTFETYLHTYQNGIEINKSFVAKTYYPKTS